MKRLLISLPIALLTIITLTIPASTHASDFSFADEPTYQIDQVVSPEIFSRSLLAADNATELPAGLTLAKGVPFITPSEVNKGDLVTIKAKATNSGTDQVNYTLALKINGKSSGAPQQVMLEPGGSKDIVFQIAAQESGNQDVRLGNLQGFFTVKEGSIFDTLPVYMWIIFGFIALVILMLVALMVTKPKKKPGTQMDRAKQQGRQKGKPGGPESQMPAGIPSQRPGMSNMPEGMLFGAQNQGQPDMAQDMQTPGMQQQYPQRPGMQQQFQQPGMQQQFQQPGMQQQFQAQQQQAGMQQPFQQPYMQQPFNQQQGTQQFPPPQTQGMQPPPPHQGMQPPPNLRSTQYPPPPQMPQGGQQPPQHMQGMPGSPQGQGAQPGMQFGMQPPPSPMPMPPGMQSSPLQPGMPPPMQPPMGQGMYHGGQPPMPGGYQPMGMPKFSVSNLTITPNKVKVGEQVNISIIVSNNGIQSGKYSVVLRIGGVVENISDLTLPPGASQTASFTVIKDTPGDYYADIDGLGGFFTVIPLAPPAFTVMNFSVGPERVRQGQPVIVTASVTNTGEITGSHTLILRVKGIAESQQEITLTPGKTENVEFQIIKDTPGFYPVSMENWTGKFVVEMDWNG